MLETVSKGFSEAKLKFSGKTKISAENIQDAVSEIRRSLLDADVEYDVVKQFVNRVEQNALGKIVQVKAGRGAGKLKVKPADHFIQICKNELNTLLGEEDASLVLPANRPATIMMVGLQGAGKTTSTGKLAKYLIDRKKKRPLLVAADVYRPAAVEQLKILGQKLGVSVYHKEGASPVEICRAGIRQAYDEGADVVLIDTAGRLTIDEKLMAELDQIKLATNPDNILFVCDAMMGQDAVTTAKSFNDRLEFSGVVMTKLDGDARGGAALSIRQVTGKPIKFLGTGEDLSRLDEFRPEGLSSRILGMGDVVGLMEDFDRVVEGDKEEEALRMLQGQFTFSDFYDQIATIQKMGPLKDVMAKLPMQNMIPKGADFDDKELVSIRAMIDSMTKQERLDPKLINQGRIQRIAKGSGKASKDVNELVKKFFAMKNMMGMLGKNMGMLGKIPGMGSLAKMGSMRKMAQQMGAPGMGDLANLMGGGAAPKKPVDREKQRKMRKAARNARKKNRKR